MLNCQSDPTQYYYPVGVVDPCYDCEWIRLAYRPWNPPLLRQARWIPRSLLSLRETRRFAARPVCQFYWRRWWEFDHLMADCQSEDGPVFEIPL